MFKHWKRGDLDGFVGLFVDNLVQLLVIVGLCGGLLGFDQELLLGSILPGAAVSLVVGNIFYARQARKLAEREGRDDVCALPYGINTPSVFAYIFLVMLPAKFYAEAEGIENPQVFAWQLGLLAAFGSGIIECFGAFVASPLRRWVPRPALLSTLAGIALGFISFTFLFKSFAVPEVGIVTLGLLLLFYFGRIKGPAGLPGGLIVLVVGIVACWITGIRNASALPEFSIGIYLPTWAGGALLKAMESEGLGAYFGVIFSMGLFNVVGSLQNLESAEAAGDKFEEGPSLLFNGLGTLAGSLFGSCFPTTIYIGHPGWKAMGARSAYSTLNAVVCSIICFTGLVSFLGWLIPIEAGMAVVVYIGIIISAQAFGAVEKRHFPAVVMGLLPGLGAWGVMMAKGGYRAAGGVFNEDTVSSFAQISDIAIDGGFALEQGFILCAMILSATTVHLIDRQFKSSASWMLVATALSSVGLMHTYTLNGGDAAFTMSPRPWPFIRAYLALTLLFALTSLFVSKNSHLEKESK